MSKKKTTAIIATLIVLVAVGIFGTNKIADMIAQNREDDLAAQAITDEQNQTSETTTMLPIEDAHIYDESGNLAIEGNPEDVAEAQATAKLLAAQQATQTTTATTEQTTEATTKAPAATVATTQSQSKPKTEAKTTTTTVESTTQATTASAPTTKTEAKTEPQTKAETTTEATTAAKSEPSGGDSGDHAGMVYDPVFGWIKSSGGESIPMEDQGGDWNKIVGSMD